MMKFALPSSITSLLSGSFRSKADEAPDTVEALLHGPAEGFLTATGNPLLDDLIAREEESGNLINEWEDLAAYYPDLAEALTEATPENLGDMLARSIVVLHHCHPRPAWGDTHDFGKHLGMGEAVYALVKSVIAENRAVMDPADGAVVLGVLCDPGGDCTRPASFAREADMNLLGLSKAWEAQTFTAIPGAVLDALASAPRDPALTKVLDRIAAKWDRHGSEIGSDVAALLPKLTALKGNTTQASLNGLGPDLLARAKGDATLLRLMDLASDSPLICKALATTGRDFRRRQAPGVLGGMAEKVANEILATDDKDARGRLIAATCRLMPFARETLETPKSYFVPVDYGISDITHCTTGVLARKPARFTEDQAMDVLRGLPEAMIPALIRNVLRAANTDDPDFDPAVEALIRRSEVRAQYDKNTRKCIDALRKALPQPPVAETDDDRAANIRAEIAGELAAMVALTPPDMSVEALEKTADSYIHAHPDRRTLKENVTRAFRFMYTGDDPAQRAATKMDVCVRQNGRIGPGNVAAGLLMLSRMAAPADDIEAKVTGFTDMITALPNSGRTRTFYGNGLEDLPKLLHDAQQRMGFYRAVPPETRAVFGTLEDFLTDAPKGTKPSAAWLKKARALLTEDEGALVRAHVSDFLASTQPGLPEHPTTYHNHADAPLLPLVWMMSEWPADEVAPILTAYALRCYVTEAGRGIRAEKIGNGCLWALQSLPDGAGTPYLARIAARVKYPKIKKKIDAALNAAAKAANVGRTELDEMIVPDHGLENGVLRLATDHGTAILEIDRAKATLRWENAAGKSVKSPPKAMQDTAAEEIKAAKALLKEVSADLSVQMQRLERLPLQDRQIPAEAFAERYLDHPLIGSACRALIWTVGDRSALWDDGALRDVTGAEVPLTAPVTMWHPVDTDPAEVIAWRDRLEARDTVQPLKQAWREVYVVTDAERATGHYSNRFAGHIVKQHQTMTLARANGWRATHRMAVDAPNDDPMWTAFPEHGVYVEYWTAAPNQDAEITDSGAFVHLHTDRIVFHRLAGDPTTGRPNALRGARLNVDEVPKVVFSEVMRHADLIVAVASLAADPGWYDRGRDAAHPSSWDETALRYFETATRAELSGAGKIRREALARILPRLKIADRVGLDGRYVTVCGVKRSYRIHIGSAAVHRNPDDRHVCIVPQSRAPKLDGVRLPFDGDPTLSLVLSKTLMLAADDKIKDPVILEQI